MRNARAARLEHYGKADAVRVEDVSLPDPQAGALLVRIYAAGLLEDTHGPVAEERTAAVAGHVGRRLFWSC